MKFNLKEVFQPKLFGLFGKGQYDGKTFTSDLIAGIIVGIIALPLAIAFGIASGVTPQQGLINCLGCPASRGETVEQACMVHGVDCDALLAKVNALIAAGE